MRLVELFATQEIPTVDFAIYERQTRMPPLERTKLGIATLVRDQRCRVRVPIEGQGALALTYKNDECAVTSMDENPDGTVWTIRQVQGGKNRYSYRVTAAMKWQQVLGDAIHCFSLRPNAEVRYITMPPTGRITNITDARSDNIEGTYEAMRRTLGMSYSHREELYIAEVTRR